MLSYPSLRVWCALVLVTPACVSLEDIPRAKDGGQEGGEVDGEDAGPGEPTPPDLEVEPYDAGLGEPTPPDAEIEPDDAGRGDLTPDAEVTGFLDGGLAWADASVDNRDAASMACATEADCSRDEICGPRKVCLPKCTPDGACVIFASARDIGKLWSDSEAVYWSTFPSRDPLGNYRSDGELWRKPVGQAQVRVSDQLGDDVSFFIADGSAYFRHGRDIHRASLSASGPSQKLYELPPGSQLNWGVGSNFIVFATDTTLSFGSLDGSAGLRSIVRDTLWDVQRRLFVSEDRIYFVLQGANSELTFKSVRMVEPYAIENMLLSEHPAYVMDVRTPYAFGNCGSIERWCRYDLRDGSKAFISGQADVGSGTQGGLVQGFVIGDWLYWYEGRWGGEGESGDRDTLGRYSLASLGTYQELLPRRYRAWSVLRNSPLIAALPGYAYVASYFTPLLYELPLPPDPCNADLPCKPGLSCSADNLCH